MASWQPSKDPRTWACKERPKNDDEGRGEVCGGVFVGGWFWGGN